MPPAALKDGKSRGFIREWMELAGLRQSDLVKRLDYSKAKAFAIWHGEQRLNEDILDEVSDLVHAKPFELLLHPEEAMRLRRLVAALRAVDESPAADDPPSEVHPARKAG